MLNILHNFYQGIIFFTNLISETCIPLKLVLITIKMMVETSKNSQNFNIFAYFCIVYYPLLICLGNGLQLHGKD